MPITVRAITSQGFGAMYVIPTLWTTSSQPTISLLSVYLQAIDSADVSSYAYCNHPSVTFPQRFGCMLFECCYNPEPPLRPRVEGLYLGSLRYCSHDSLPRWLSCTLGRTSHRKSQCEFDHNLSLDRGFLACMPDSTRRFDCLGCP